MSSIPVAGQTVAVAGVDSFILKGKETTFGSKAASINKHFGVVQRITPVQRNSLIQIRGFKGTTTGGRAMIKALGGRLEVGVSVDFQPQVWEFLEDSMGAVSGTGTVGDPYVYVKANSLPSYSIATSIELGSTDQDVVLLGSIVDTCTIRAAMGEPVSVSMTYLSADIMSTPYSNSIDRCLSVPIL